MVKASVGWLIALLAFLIYRNFPALKSNAFFPSKFPIGYIANGTFSKDCTSLGDPSGELNYCEDASFWEVTNDDTKLERRVLISCDPGRKAWNTVMGPLRNPEPHGALWVLRPGSSKVHRVAFLNYPEGHDFHPLGAEAYPSHSGKPTNLFVINHAREKTVIEQFLLSHSEPYSASWLRTISHPAFVAPNALALTGPDSFFVTNDHLITRRWPVIGHFVPLIETLLALPFGWIAHVEVPVMPSTEPVKIKHTFAALGIPFANGIAISPSGNTLAVSSTSLGMIYFYSRDAITNKLSYKHAVRVPFSPDNLSYDEQGFLIAAGHPHFPSLIKVAANATGSTAPSWVVAIRERGENEEPVELYDTSAPVPASKVSPSETHVVETVFQSNGVGFGMSTTGLRDGNTVYIPGLYERGLLVCKTSARGST